MLGVRKEHRDARVVEHPGHRFCGDQTRQRDDGDARQLAGEDNDGEIQAVRGQ
jgi:hypothetical protein